MAKQGSQAGVNNTKFQCSGRAVILYDQKKQTAFRPSLDPKGTLSSILTIKLAAKVPAHAFEPSKEVLTKAKAATWECNKVHCTKKTT